MSAIIFDFDGTIADSFDLVLDLFYELTGHERFTPEEIAKLRRIPSLRKLAKAVGLSPRQAPRVYLKGRTMMGKRMVEVGPCKGMDTALETLHRQGHQLFVMSSNSQRNVEAFLRTHNLRKFFQGVYGGVGLLSKAGALNKVVRLNQLDVEQTFYVGDEVRDVHAAKRAHVRAVSVSWGYNDAAVLEREKPFAVAKTPKDLPRIFGAKGLAATVLSRARIFSFRRS